jgi:hypothetical protein
MRSHWIAAILALPLTVGAIGSSHASPLVVSCPEKVPQEGMDKRVAALKRLILQGLLREWPHAGARGPTGIFGGNVDWHSAVHGHWALLSMARVTDDAGLEAALLKRLTIANLRAEVKYLEKHPSFERPYGRSWFLLLLSELQRRPSLAGDPDLADMRLAVEIDLAQDLSFSDFPESRRRVASGSYDSWLFQYLMIQMSGPMAPSTQALLPALLRSRLNPARGRIPDNPHVTGDFLFAQSLLFMVDATRPGASLPTAFDEAYTRQTPPDPRPDFGNPHDVGRAVVAHWPYAMLSHADPAACSEFHSMLNTVFRHPNLWRDGFAPVSHWVPQLLWMGMWLEMGRP